MQIAFVVFGQFHEIVARNRSVVVLRILLAANPNCFPQLLTRLRLQNKSIWQWIVYGDWKYNYISPKQKNTFQQRQAANKLISYLDRFFKLRVNACKILTDAMLRLTLFICQIVLSRNVMDVPKTGQTSEGVCVGTNKHGLCKCLHHQWFINRKHLAFYISLIFYRFFLPSFFPQMCQAWDACKLYGMILNKWVDQFEATVQWILIEYTAGCTERKIIYLRYEYKVYFTSIKIKLYYRAPPSSRRELIR